MNETSRERRDACPFRASETGVEAGCVKALRNGEPTGGDTAVGAYWAFFEGFNSRDAQRFSSALNYPHVRFSPRRTPAVVPTLAAHAAAMSWDGDAGAGHRRLARFQAGGQQRRQNVGASAPDAKPRQPMAVGARVGTVGE